MEEIYNDKEAMESMLSSIMSLKHRLDTIDERSTKAEVSNNLRDRNMSRLKSCVEELEITRFDIVDDSDHLKLQLIEHEANEALTMREALLGRLASLEQSISSLEERTSKNEEVLQLTCTQLAHQMKSRMGYEEYETLQQPVRNRIKTLLVSYRTLKKLVELDKEEDIDVCGITQQAFTGGNKTPKCLSCGRKVPSATKKIHGLGLKPSSQHAKPAICPSSKSYKKSDEIKDHQNFSPFLSVKGFSGFDSQLQRSCDEAITFEKFKNDDDISGKAAYPKVRFQYPGKTFEAEQTPPLVEGDGKGIQIIRVDRPTKQSTLQGENLTPKPQEENSTVISEVPQGFPVLQRYPYVESVAVPKSELLTTNKKIDLQLEVYEKESQSTSSKDTYSQFSSEDSAREKAPQKKLPYSRDNVLAKYHSRQRLIIPSVPLDEKPSSSSVSSEGKSSIDNAESTSRTSESPVDSDQHVSVSNPYVYHVKNASGSTSSDDANCSDPAPRDSPKTKRLEFRTPDGKTYVFDKKRNASKRDIFDDKNYGLLDFGQINFTDQTAHRPCGGSHTKTSPLHRTLKTRNFRLPERGNKPVSIKASDGGLYQGLAPKKDNPRVPKTLRFYFDDLPEWTKKFDDDLTIRDSAIFTNRFSKT